MSTTWVGASFNFGSTSNPSGWLAAQANLLKNDRHVRSTSGDGDRLRQQERKESNGRQKSAPSGFSCRFCRLFRACLGAARSFRLADACSRSSPKRLDTGRNRAAFRPQMVPALFGRGLNGRGATDGRWWKCLHRHHAGETACDRRTHRGNLGSTKMVRRSCIAVLWLKGRYSSGQPTGTCTLSPAATATWCRKLRPGQPFGMPQSSTMGL